MAASLKAAKHRPKHFAWITVFWIYVPKKLCSRNMFLYSCALTGTRVSQEEGRMWNKTKDLDPRQRWKLTKAWKKCHSWKKIQRSRQRNWSFNKITRNNLKTYKIFGVAIDFLSRQVTTLLRDFGLSVFSYQANTKFLKFSAITRLFRVWPLLIC